jgi:hypothetical protein
MSPTLRRGRLGRVGSAFFVAIPFAGWWIVLVTQTHYLLGGVLAVVVGVAVFLGGLALFPDIRRHRTAGDLGPISLLATVSLATMGVLIGLLSIVPAQDQSDPPGSDRGPAVDDSILQAGLLVPEDLPDGWTYLKEGEIGGPSGVNAQQYCSAPRGAQVIAQESVALAEPETLFGQRESVFSVVAIFEVEDALQFMDDVARSVQCGEWRPGADPDLVYRVRSRADLGADLGDDVLWLELSNTGGGPQTASHVYVRVGEVVGLLVHNSPTGSSSDIDIQGVARTLALKLTRVDALLQ